MYIQTYYKISIQFTSFFNKEFYRLEQKEVEECFRDYSSIIYYLSKIFLINGKEICCVLYTIDYPIYPDIYIDKFSSLFDEYSEDPLNSFDLEVMNRLNQKQNHKDNLNETDIL